MTTEQGNRLIATFMNYPENGKLAKDPYYYAMKHCYDNDLMKYHEDWNWLMAVVEKIEKDVSASIFYGFTVEIMDLRCTIWCRERGKKDGVVYQTPYGHRPTSKIEAVWQAVVQFIQWYNSNTQTTDNGQ